MIDLYLKTTSKIKMEAALIASGLFVYDDSKLRPVDSTVLLDVVGPSPADSTERGYFVNLRLIYADEVPEVLVPLQTSPVTPWRVWA
jgi:hypothetical protein